jgi:outer membrane protein
MPRDIRRPLLAAIFCAGAAVAAAAPVRAETLADAVALAYDTNPTLQAQRATQRALDESYVQARTGWRPTLNLQGQALHVDIRTPHDAAPILLQPQIFHANEGSLAITFAQPIWTGGRTAAAVSAAQADIMSGRENLRRVEAQVMLSVIQAYMDVRRDQEALRIHQEDVAVLQKQLDESNARFEVGEITRTDVAQSEARLAASQALLQQAQAQLAISRAEYAAVVGQNPGELAPEPTLVSLLPSNVDEAFQVAEQNNPGLRAQQYAEQASRARVAGAKAGRMPTFGVQTELQFLNGPIDPLKRDLYQREETVAGVLSVPLFSGGLVSSQIRQAVERNNTDRINVETQRRAVLQVVTQAWSQLLAARANIGSLTAGEKSAGIAAEGTREEQRVGLRTVIDVLNAEVDLRSAQLGLVGARHDEFVAAAAVLSAMGRLEARDLIPSVPQYDPKAPFRKLHMAPGWVPWEEPIGALDRVGTYAPSQPPKELPAEKPVGQGLQPAPASTARK